MVTIIVTYDVNKGIGFKGSVPWKIPEEKGYVSSLTSGGAVVMGRKTWDSLPITSRPLVNRDNYVLTNSEDFIRGDASIGVKGQIYVKDITTALKLSRGKETYIIGGEKIYKQTIHLSEVRRIIACELKGEYRCDRFFPDPHINDWEFHGIMKKFDHFNVVEWWKRLSI